MDEIEEKKKFDKGYHPNSVKNLKPIQKGQVLNPLGAKAHDPAKRALRNLSNSTVNEIITLAMTGTLDELQEIVNNPHEAALKRGLAKAIGDAVANGDAIMLERLFERITGKVPIVVENRDAPEPQVILTMPSNGREIESPDS